MLVLMAAPASASAFCSRGFSADFDSQINSEFKYLICLNNQPNDDLNSNAASRNSKTRALNDHADFMNRLAHRQDEINASIGAL